MRKFLSILILAVLCASCRTQYVEVDRVVHDSINVETVRIDSFIHLDSVFEKIFVKGDTTTIEREHRTIIYEPRYIYETKYVSHVDSVPYPVEIPAQLSKLDSLKLRLGGSILGLLGIILSCVLGVGIWLAIKYIKK